MLDDPRTAGTAQFLAEIHRSTGARIRRAREAAGLTREQLAQALAARGHTGWTSHEVERMEAGRHVWREIEGDLRDLIGFTPALDSRATSLDAAVGANVRSIRIDSGISQGELAARLTTIGTAWTASNVSLIESGKRKLTLVALADLCRVFQLPPSAFFGTQGFGQEVSTRLQALGGQAAATLEARPTLHSDAAAAELTRQRLAMRVLGRVVARIPWDLNPELRTATLEELREAALDAIEDLYGTRDILSIREDLALAAIQQSPSDSPPSLDHVADSRAWATRRLIDQVTTYLCLPDSPPADIQAKEATTSTDPTPVHRRGGPAS